MENDVILIMWYFLYFFYRPTPAKDLIPEFEVYAFHLFPLCISVWCSRWNNREYLQDEQYPFERRKTSAQKGVLIV